MYRVMVNSEDEVQVIVDFEEMVEFNDECIDDCVEAIYSVTKKFDGITEDHISEPQDYYYTIECIDENQASYVEDVLKSLLEEIEEELEEMEEEFF